MKTPKRRKQIKKSIIAGLACFIFVFLICTGILHGKGLAVSPASYTWEIRRFGEKVKMPMGIMIINRSEKKCLYRLRAKIPEVKKVSTDVDAVSIQSLKAEWVSFDEPLIEVLPQSSKEVSVYIKIPEIFTKPAGFQNTDSDP